MRTQLCKYLLFESALADFSQTLSARVTSHAPFLQFSSKKGRETPQISMLLLACPVQAQDEYEQHLATNRAIQRLRQGHVPQAYASSPSLLALDPAPHSQPACHHPRLLLCFNLFGEFLSC